MKFKCKCYECGENYVVETATFTEWFNLPTQHKCKEGK